MAVHFIHRGGYDMGQHVYTASKEEIMIGIIHDPKNGYRLAHGGAMIKEQLGLKEFMERLVRVEHFQLGFSEIQSKVKRDLYTIIEAITSRNSSKIESVAEWLDQRYSDLIRNKKLTLMEHNYSINVQQLAHREGSIEQMKPENIHVHQPITFDEAFQKEGITDDEVYYLTVL